MKKKSVLFALVLALIMACFIKADEAPMIIEESYDFDYGILDSMSLNDLEKLHDKVGNKIAELKGEEWEKGNHYDHTVYQVGDTWEVRGLWKFTVDSIIETTEGLDVPDEKPEAMYLVTFTCENIGYIYKAEGLKFWLHFDGTASDSSGEIGECYSDKEWLIPGVKVPEFLPVGTHGTFTEAVGVSHPGNITLTLHKEGNNFDEHIAVFSLEP